MEVKHAPIWKLGGVRCAGLRLGATDTAAPFIETTHPHPALRATFSHPGEGSVAVRALLAPHLASHPAPL